MKPKLIYDKDRIKAPETRIPTLEQAIAQATEHRNQYLEELARALIKELGITVETIDQIELVEERQINKTIWYYRKRTCSS